ncbi:acyl-CoA dehydrogenase family protein [Pseudooceanicola sp.]|jgi:alkylation response protein AidB-like acyl-CoA dehydrogenase|uniref:acyl-CoA dehydrogenase family protein n=1 Tax=Pseudooceanicola sp. TaxID=1914328 RepID=UPI00405A2BBA
MLDGMDKFGLTEDQKLMRDSLGKMIGRLLPPDVALRMDEAREFPEEAYQALARAGYMGLLYPEENGGLGASMEDFTFFIETVAYHNTQLASAYLTSVLYGGRHVQVAGTPELRDEILPGVIDGTRKMAFCLTEPDTGSDAASIKTRARADGDDFIIHGHKMFITCAHVADQLIVVTKTDPDSGHRGITMFVVDAKAAGVSITPMKTLGRRTIHANTVTFDSVRVPAYRMLGTTNGGWGQLMLGLNLERICLSASAVGNMQRIVDYASGYARERVQFGHPVSSYQAVAHKLVDMQIMTDAGRGLTYRAARLLDADADCSQASAVAKIFTTEKNVQCADMGMQVMGGAGYSMDHLMQMFWRDSRVGPIGGGTNEILRNVIGKRMGLM